MIPRPPEAYECTICKICRTVSCGLVVFVDWQGSVLAGNRVASVDRYML